MGYTFEAFEKDLVRRKLQGILLNTTAACNLRCRYCFIEEYPQMNMTLEVAEQSLKFLEENKDPTLEKPSVNFFGGEPLMNFPLIKTLIDKYKDKYKWGITTNGVALSQEVVDFFREHNVDILLSIDGGKETQDINRPCVNGEGSFDIVASNIPYLLENFPFTTFRSTLYPPSVHNFAADYQFAKDQGFRGYFAVPDEYSKWTAENIADLQKGLELMVTHYIADITSFGAPRTPFSHLNQFFMNFLQHRDNPQIQFNKTPFRCGMGFASAGVGVTGKIFACQEFATIQGGHLFEIGNIYDGFNDQKHYSLIKQYANQLLLAEQAEEKCYSCFAKTICLTEHCPSRNYSLEQNFNYKTEIRCVWTQLLFKAAMILALYFEESPCEGYETWLTKLLGEEGKGWNKELST